MANYWPEKALHSKTLRNEIILPSAEDVGFASVFMSPNGMYLNLARLLWGFNIEHARDESGNIIPVDFTTDGLLPDAMCTAIPFQCCTLPFQSVV